MKTVKSIFHRLKRHRTVLQKAILKRSNIKVAQLKLHEINTLRFLSVQTPTLLARILKTSLQHIQDLINHPAYVHYTIPKKKGGERDIYAPNEDLKRIQKRINYYLQAFYLCIKPEEVHGFVINPSYLETTCNIVANAKVHTQKKYVLNVDLKDFFSSITAKQVKALFTSTYFQFEENIANALTFLTSYQGKLPTGSPTSPVISNFVCLQLDSDLRKFSISHELSFTRYADDLTFSSNYPISTDNILDIINIIKVNHFTVNSKKLRLISSVRKQTVTGLVVNEKVNIDRKILKQIRAMLHHLNTEGLKAATQKHLNLKGEPSQRAKNLFLNRIEGYVNFVGQVRGKKDDLYSKFSKSIVAFYENSKD